jgi:flagellum-specific ATP synthase
MSHSGAPVLLAPFFDHLQIVPSVRWEGRVTQVHGQIIESEGPVCAVGECCLLVGEDRGEQPGEIVGFRDSTVLSVSLGGNTGVRHGDHVITWGERPSVRVGDDWLGRVVDACGVPLDGLGPCRGTSRCRLDASPPGPLERTAIRTAIGCGVRAIDGLLTCGRGQRLGIFGGSGVGKSTLIGMMARGTAADMTVLALVGERGREVREFLEEALGEEGRRRSVVVVSTSDQSPLLKVRAVLTATAVAEYFSAQGRAVLLVVDSLTRLAMAQREIGLAAGEPPTAKGYTPSVFSLMARVIERAGQFERGSITAFYTVLMEGDDHQDPLVDGARALLDGHIVLDRRLAARGYYPPISILDSLSRLMTAVATPEHLNQARELRQLLASYTAAEDLIRLGAYAPGADAVLDRAVRVIPRLTEFLKQDKNERAALAESVGRLLALGG